MKKRGRPSKLTTTKSKAIVVKTVKMNELSFDKNLFTPMKTNTKVDQFFSADGGVMPGTNIVVTGDPGVGKTTVLLDMLGDLQTNNKSCLFISGEMNAIDMVGYVKRYPKFGKLDILFLGDYADEDPEQVITEALKPGYDCVLVDSMIEVADMMVDYHGGTNKGASGRLLQLFEYHNMGLNNSKRNTSFLIIQQVTKSGGFAGSNKLKHMTTAMAHLKFEPNGERYLHFSKNRRGGNMNKLFYSLSSVNRVGWMHEAPLIEE
jgi:DNA repair protein RadA/Sms